MATKEDILEQIVDEYLVHKGYFVQHNPKFLPRKDQPDFVTNQCPSRNKGFLIALSGVAFLALPPS